MMDKAMMMHKKHKMMRKISRCLVMIGGINWGLIGAGAFYGKDWNVVHKLLGAWPKIEWIVYILVGLAALKMIFHRCRHGMMKNACCGCGCDKCDTCAVDGMEKEKMM